VPAGATAVQYAMIGGMRRTKIVATIGPASSSREVLRELFDAGLDMARVTLAHGTIEGQKAVVSTIREEADAAGRPVGILVDLPGPKVRTTSFASEVQLQRDDRVTLRAGRTEPSTSSTIVVDYPTLVEDLTPGDVVVIGDGGVRIEVESSDKASLAARVLHGGQLSGRKGFRIPTARFRATAPTPEDLKLIDTFRDAPVDVLAVSFVRSAADIAAVRKALGPNPPWVMAKIETAAAVNDLTAIVDASDAVMVARGDLGTDLPIEDVPHLQKRIIRDTVRSGKPVLVATQMLESMVEAQAPTRAEATDVANAVLDQTSAVMLSAETAIGRDPVAVVRTMARLIARAEQELDPARLQWFAVENRPLSNPNVAIAHATWHLANDLRPAAILCCTRTGATARHMASFRPLTALYGLTADRRAARQLCLCWSVRPLLEPQAAASTEDVVRRAVEVARAAGAVAAGDLVVVLAGSPDAGPGHTDTIRVVTV
jgi:pyruvate kinase